MHIRRFLVAVLSLVVLVGASSPAWAGWKERTEAQKLFNEGIKQEKGESWQAAREAFESSVELNDTPKARYRLANALYNLGLLIEAREHAQQVADNKRAGWWDRKHSKDLLKQIEQRVCHITVSVPPDFDGVLRLDDKQLTSDAYGTRMEVNPGTVIVRAEAQGFVPFEKSVVLSDAADETVSVKLEPEAAPEPEKDKVEVSTDDGSTRKTIGYVSLAVGGVGLIAGTAFGLAARGTRDDLTAACVDDVCSETQRDTYDRGKMQANISTAGFLVGGVGLGLGAVLLLTGPQDKESEAASAKVQPYVGPMSAGVHGRF